MTRLTLTIIVLFTLISCNKKIKPEQIEGCWNTTSIKVDIPNVPELLIKNAETLALATQYTIKSDYTFVMMISENELEKVRKNEGKWILDENKKIITFETNQVFILKYRHL